MSNVETQQPVKTDVPSLLHFEGFSGAGDVYLRPEIIAEIYDVPAREARADLNMPFVRAFCTIVSIRGTCFAVEGSAREHARRVSEALNIALPVQV
jgi:hypothetical protein